MTQCKALGGHRGLIFILRLRDGHRQRICSLSMTIILENGQGTSRWRNEASGDAKPNISDADVLFCFFLIRSD